MLPSFATQSVAILRATTTEDAHGNEVPDWANPAVTVVQGCSVQPLTSDEVNRSRDAVMGSVRVFMPPGVDVLASDRLRLAGTGGDYEIVGEPLRWPSPTGGLDHVELIAKRWGG